MFQSAKRGIIYSNRLQIALKAAAYYRFNPLSAALFIPTKCLIKERETKIMFQSAKRGIIYSNEDETRTEYWDR